MNIQKISWQGVGYLIACMVLCINITTSAQTGQTKKLDRLCAWLAAQSQGMGSVAVAKNGNVIYANAFGFRTQTDNQTLPANADTKYHIWSITKMYTATMVLQLVEEGKLSLDATLNRYFPNIANASSITIRQMLSHQSGIHDFTQIGDSVSLPKNDTRQEMVLAIAAQKPEFAPGERFEYSNSNYLLLGYILEDIEQTSFAEILSRRILHPLGLTNTFYQKAVADTIQNCAKAYQFVDDRWQYVEEGSLGTNVPGAAGSIVSTPADMTKAITALFAGRLLSPASLNQMTTTQDFYALGIMKMPHYDLPGWGHSGGYIASHSILIYYPQDSLAVAYCTNGVRYPLHQINSHIVNIFRDPSYVLPFEKTVITLTAAQQHEYTGKYESSKFPVDITLENGALIIHAGKNPQSPIRPMRKDHFYIEGTDMEIHFDRGRDKKITTFTILQGDRKIVASRSTGTNKVPSPAQ
jgi:D-alanyl-D-alanine carboxypeptidase